MKPRNTLESEKGIALCNYACVVCGWNQTSRDGKPLVQGAHVKAFSDDSCVDCYNNIIALCPNHHLMFDRFLFCIDAESRHTIFFDSNDKYHDIDISSKIKHIKKEYLAYSQYRFNKGK